MNVLSKILFSNTVQNSILHIKVFCWIHIMKFLYNVIFDIWNHLSTTVRSYCFLTILFSKHVALAVTIIISLWFRILNFLLFLNWFLRKIFLYSSECKAHISTFFGKIILWHFYGQTLVHLNQYIVDYFVMTLEKLCHEQKLTRA